MKIGVNFGGYPCSVDEQIELMERYGFTATFAGSANPSIDEIMTKCREHGIVVESHHAPFGRINGIWMEGEEGDSVLAELISCVDECERYGVPTLVVHLSSGERPPRINDVGASRFERLVKYADEHKVTIAFENQRMLGNLAFVLEEFETAGFCWDVGHETAFAGGKEFMPLFGDRIVALHLHDNHCEHNGDEHLIPFDGIIDMDKAARRLAEAGYDKAIMLELVRKNSHHYDETDAETYFARAAEAAREFASRVELYKKKILSK